MKILDYVINSKVFIKTEPTAFTSLPIDNTSDNFYLILPTLVNELPNDVMFINDSLLIAPHTTKDYIPKFVRLGTPNIGQRLSVEVNGIKLKLIIIDTISADDMVVTESYTLKTNSKIMHNNNLSTINNSNTKLTSDGVDIKTDTDTAFILNMIDSRINQRIIGSNVSTLMSDDMSKSPIATAITNDIININTNPLKPKKKVEYDENGNPIQRKRGRPRKYPISNTEVTNILIGK